MRQLSDYNASPSVSVIVPVYIGGRALRRCLAALAEASPAPTEVIVVADGEGDGAWRAAGEFGATLVKLAARSGAAAARNAGSRVARGQILFFVDADVVAPPDAVEQVAAAFAADATLAAMFGSYDDAPAEANFLSQYKNLLHHHTHQSGRAEAFTFWTGCGAIRRKVFLNAGGFAEGGELEDVELGYRLCRAGHRIVLRKQLQVKHLKRWGPCSLLKSDLVHRAIPWAGLILRQGRVNNDLDLRYSNRASVVLAYLLVMSLAAGCWRPHALWLAAGCALGLLALNRGVYLFFRRKRGLAFTAAAVPWHWIYYLCGGLGFGIGVVLRLCERWSGGKIRKCWPSGRFTRHAPIQPPRSFRPPRPGSSNNRTSAAMDIAPVQEEAGSLPGGGTFERPVRLGLVGFGRLAREYYVRALATLGGVRLVAVADPLPESQAAAEKTFAGVRTFASHQELLESEAIDGLLVASPPSAHLTAWLDSARAGIPVFMEKPFVLARELPRALEAAEAAPLLLINFNRRFWPAYRRMGELARAGAVGQLQDARFVLQVNVKAWCAVTQHRLQAGEGGALYDLGSQVLDLACAMLGQQPASVWARTSSERWKDDHVHVTLQMPGGLRVECEVAYDVPTRERIMITGSEGVLRIDDPNAGLHRIVSSARGRGVSRRLKDLFIFGGRALRRDQSMSRYTIRSALQHFVSGVRAGNGFQPGFDAAVRNSLLLEAAARSAAENCEVPVNPMNAGVSA